MKLFLFLPLSTAGVLLALSPLGAAPGNSTMRDQTTHDKLSNSLRMARQNDPIQNLGPAAGDVEKDPSAQEGPRDLIKESTILCYLGNLTLIPNQAVLHLPERLKDRFQVQPNIKVLTWSEFYQINRGWIKTIEVTREQAMGEVAMPENIVEAYQKSSSVIVATFSGGPISVLPVREPATVEASEAAIEPTLHSKKPIKP